MKRVHLNFIILLLNCSSLHAGNSVDCFGASKDKHGSTYAGYTAKLLDDIFCVSHVL